MVAVVDFPVYGILPMSWPDPTAPIRQPRFGYDLDRVELMNRLSVCYHNQNAADVMRLDGWSLSVSGHWLAAATEEGLKFLRGVPIE